MPGRLKIVYKNQVLGSQVLSKTEQKCDSCSTRYRWPPPHTDAHTNKNSLPSSRLLPRNHGAGDQAPRDRRCLRRGGRRPPHLRARPQWQLQRTSVASLLRSCHVVCTSYIHPLSFWWLCSNQLIFYVIHPPAGLEERQTGRWRPRGAQPAQGAAAQHPRDHLHADGPGRGTSPVHSLHHYVWRKYTQY